MRAIAEEERVFDVPNSLRARALGADRNAEDLDDRWRNVLRWKAIRLGRQLEASTALLTKTAIPSGDEAAMSGLVARMVHAAGELQGYALQGPGPAFTAVADFCAEMRGSRRTSP